MTPRPDSTTPQDPGEKLTPAPRERPALTRQFIVLARLGLFAVTLFGPPLYYLVINPIFTTPNTLGDGLSYLENARRLLDTGSPYQDWQLSGVDAAITPGTFRYPPLFAQFAALFVITNTASIFLLLLVATCFLASLVLARSRGDVALALWLGLAFVPNWIAAWEGQVTGLLAIAVGIALLGRPLGLWAGAALKVVPGLALPAAFLRAPRAVLISAAAFVPILAMSVIASPTAWIQFPTVLLNESTLGTEHESLALAGAARFLVLAVVAACLLGSLLVARRNWPLSLYLAVVAGLLGPAFFPKYALPVVTPFLFIGLRDQAARPWAVAAFVPLALPVITFSLPIYAGMALLGVSMARLPGVALGQPAASVQASPRRRSHAAVRAP